MFSRLKRKCIPVWLGRSGDGENRIEKSKAAAQKKKRPYLVCLFTWLAGLASEGRAEEEEGGKSAVGFAQEQTFSEPEPLKTEADGFVCFFGFLCGLGSGTKKKKKEKK